MNPLCWSVTILASQEQAVEGRRLVLFLEPRGPSRLGKTRPETHCKKKNVHVLIFRAESTRRFPTAILVQKDGFCPRPVSWQRDTCLLTCCSRVGVWGVWEALCRALEVFHGDTWCGGCDVFFWQTHARPLSVPGVNLQSKYPCRGTIFYLSIKRKVRDM